MPSGFTNILLIPRILFYVVLYVIIKVTQREEMERIQVGKGDYMIT